MTPSPVLGQKAAPLRCPGKGLLQRSPLLQAGEAEIRVHGSKPVFSLAFCAHLQVCGYNLQPLLHKQIVLGQR